MVRIFTQHVRKILFAVLLAFLTTSSAYAYNVTWGGSATINWNVTGASDCLGSTNYPDIADGVEDSWVATHPSSGSTVFPNIQAPPATYTFTCTNSDLNPDVSDSDTLVVSCPVGESWDGNSCEAPLSGTITASASTCTIASGASTCSRNLTWSTTNPTGTSVVYNGTSNIYTANSGTSQPADVGNGARTFSLKHNGTTLDTVIVTGSCAAGTSWDGSSCEPPTGSFNPIPADCTIVSGSSTCTTSFKWSTSNSTTTVSIRREGVQIYTGASTTTTKYGTVDYGTNLTTFTIYTAGYTLDTENVSGTCSSTTTWDSANSRCWGADLVAGSAIPITATQGVAVTLSARITNSGKYTTGASFNNFFQVATSSNGGGAGIQDLGYVTMSTLATGAGATTSKSYTFTTSGTKSIRACADKNNSGSAGVIKESDETNNCGPWVNVTVAAPAVTGSFSPVPADCLIVSGSSTCTTTFGWNTSNSTTTVNIQRDGSTIHTGTSGSSKKSSVVYGTNLTTLTILTGGAVLDTETVSGSCDASSTWDTGTGKCVGLCQNGANNPPDCDQGNIMTGALNASPISCLIATGASTCTTHLSWSTTNPVGTSAVTRDGTPGNLYTGNDNADQITNVPFDIDGAIVYRLYNNALELDTTSVNVACAAGGSDRWDTTNSMCADPTVVSVVVNGTYGYGGAGSLDIVCANSDTYSVVRDLSGDNELIDSGPYTTATNTPLTVSDNYSVFCKHGSVSSSPTTVRYDTPPPPSSLIFINATPKTMDFQGKSAVNWVIQYPEAACALTAYPVCTGGVCSQAQLDAAVVLNNVIDTENTDADDQGNGGGGPRSITDAVNTIAPGHEETDWKALGKKTFTVTKSTDFTIDCGNNNTATTRVRITNSNEE